jgi:hypothetical protein
MCTVTVGIAAALAATLTATGCGTPSAAAWRPAGTSSGVTSSTTPLPSGSSAPATTKSATPTATVVAPGPPANGNPNGHATVPAEAQAEDTSKPARVIGTGSAASCTSAAVVSAVAAGGISTFNCGSAPVTITMTATAKVHNNTGKTVLDGKGLVTLSGGGVRRILYQNTCDRSLGPSKSDCLTQTDTQLVVQNLTFADGNSTGDTTEGGGGGAILVRGGRLKVVNSKFVRNKCDTTGPDLGGAAVRITIQYHHKPNYFVSSTFGGAQGQGGTCSNGGAISGLHASVAVYNSVLSFNSAIGNGANPARTGTPGGGSGGAIYTDGDLFTVGIYGTLIADNHAKEGGGAIFMVSNDRTGTLTIDSSTMQRNPSDGFQNSPGIFFLGSGKPVISNSTVKN